MSKITERDREILQSAKEKSEDDFEKKVTYISAGALGLSLTFIEKIVHERRATCLGLLISSWALLIFTLLLNLLSHSISSYYHDKTTQEFDREDENLESNIDKRNKRLWIINIVTIATLIFGIVLLVTFVSINLVNMKDLDQKPNITTVNNPVKMDPDTLARTITKPAPAPPSTGTTTDKK